MLRAAIFVLIGICGQSLLPAGARAQDISLNYDALASLEEPLAKELGGITFSLTGLVDVSASVGTDRAAPEETEFEPGFVGNFQLLAQTQLGNRWRLGAAYFGQYATDSFDGLLAPEGYSDNVAGFIGTSFGTMLIGNVSGQVRELTRRRRGAGNAALALDNFLLRLDQWGLAYTGQFGPTVFGAVLDEQGNFELGASFQRPRGVIDYRLTGRVVHIRRDRDPLRPLRGTDGASGVVELTYGSSIFDLSLGIEELRIMKGDETRWYTSTGVRTQMGPTQLSAEGHYGRVAGRDEYSLAMGGAYFLARGLTFNLGANYQKRALDAQGAFAPNEDEFRVLASARYSF